jgi:putative restriction endonuclease
MTRDAVLGLFDRLNVWSRGDQLAPHKPLLVLYALGRWSRGEPADIPFTQVDADLTGLLKEFGPPRQSYHPEYPFWRLQNDGVWVVHAAGPPHRARVCKIVPGVIQPRSRIKGGNRCVAHSLP